MRKFALLGASALVLALGVASASAEPYNPSSAYTDQAAQAYGHGYTYGATSPYIQSAGPSSVLLQEFHEGK